MGQHTNPSAISHPKRTAINFFVYLLLLSTYCQVEGESFSPSDMRIFKRRDFIKTEKDISDLHKRGKRQVTNEMLQSYLSKYGYAAPSHLTAGSNVAELHSMTEAIKEMQRFLGLPETGEFDEKTQQMIQKPRCANPDITQATNNRRRKKRYTTVGSTWKNLRITYSINNVTPKIGRVGTHRAIDNAFAAWAAHAPLDFVKVSKDDKPDIVILFAKGEHDDNTAFDGEGGYLAHAYYPGPGIGGDTHFDAEEPWVVNKPYQGNDLFLVAVHELGHALGLGHSPDTTAIMAPVYQYHQTTNYQLPQDDINGIQALYGVRNSPSTTTPTTSTTTTTTRRTTTRRTSRYYPTRRYPPRRPTPGRTAPPPLDVCSIKKFDAVSFIRNEFYVFSSQYMWRKYAHEKKPRGPYGIAGFWPAVGSGVDAAFENLLTGNIVFIKGKNYYEYDGNRLLPRYPRRLRSMNIYEENIDAGIWWYRNNRTYLFKGDKYWRLDDYNLEEEYPKDMSKWPGVPNDVDAAFIGPGDDGVNHTYFVKGDRYWRFHSKQVEVISEHASFANDWLGCENVATEPRSTPSPTDVSPPPTGVSIPAIAAVSIVILILIVALGIYIAHQRKIVYKYPPSDPRHTPAPAYRSGYHSHIEEEIDTEQRYLWVKTFHHGWNNFKFSLQQKV